MSEIYVVGICAVSPMSIIPKPPSSAQSPMPKSSLPFVSSTMGSKASISDPAKVAKCIANE